jgi:hypothetical protein
LRGDGDGPRWIAIFIWIFVAFALLAIVFSGIVSHWQTIAALAPATAAFLGAIVGAGGGLVAIVFGALLNAALNRQRDDRLRREEGRNLAVALHGEMLSIIDSYRRHQKTMTRMIEKYDGDTRSEKTSLTSSPPCSARIFASSSDRLGLLQEPERNPDLDRFQAALSEDREITKVAISDAAERCRAWRDIGDTVIERADKLVSKLASAAARLASAP